MRSLLACLLLAASAQAQDCQMQFQPQTAYQSSGHMRTYAFFRNTGPVQSKVYASVISDGVPLKIPVINGWLPSISTSYQGNWRVLVLDYKDRLPYENYANMTQVTNYNGNQYQGIVYNSKATVSKMPVPEAQLVPSPTLAPPRAEKTVLPEVTEQAVPAPVLELPKKSTSPLISP